jgi:hypothetical protein
MHLNNVHLGSPAEDKGKCINRVSKKTLFLSYSLQKQCDMFNTNLFASSKLRPLERKVNDFDALARFGVHGGG